jgi:energy-coupling factor transporter transmembrane protein EcfT
LSKNSAVSPLASLFAVIINTIPVFISFDTYTPLAFLFLAILNSILVLHIPPGRMLFLLSLLVSLPMGLFILNLFFYSDNSGDVLINILGHNITTPVLTRSLVVFLRSLALIYVSIAYLIATKPVDLVSALMQQLHLSPRIGFAVYAAWNTVPQLKKNFSRIRHTHEIRRGGEMAKLADIVQMVSTLLIGSIRHAERISISMSVRGIESVKERSYIRENRWKFSDTIYLIVYTMLSVSILVLLIRNKLFVFGLG